MGLTRQECLNDLPFPSPGKHIVSKLSTMTHQSWVCLHDIAHSFTVKALINFTKLWSNCSVLLFFCNCCFYSVFPLKDKGKRIVEASWLEVLYLWESESCSNGQGHAQFSSVTQSYLILCNPMDCSRPGFPVNHQLLELAQTHVQWVSDAIQPSHPLSSPSPVFNICQNQGLFKWVSTMHQMAKVLESFSFSISPSSEYSGLISLRVDWFDPLAVQGTLKSILQYPSSKASIFGFQLSLYSNSHIHTWPLEKT